MKQFKLKLTIMSHSNDPKHEQEPDDLNETHENNDTKASSNISPKQEAEAERLIQQEKKIQKAQRITISRKFSQSVSYLVAALEILLGLRFLLLVTGANRENIFASFIYSLSKPFSVPFSNLFGTIQFNSGNNVFDINILFAMIVYLLLMILVRWLIKIIANP